MIFITVGTEQFPFDRLLKTIDEGIRTGQIKEKVFAQSGHSRYSPLLFDCRSFLDFDEMIKSIQRSDIIITHAGVGSILLCMSLDKIPIVFPRYAHLGEHVDDHQVEFARQMENERKVFSAYSKIDLFNKVKSYESLVNQLRQLNLISNFNKSNLLDQLKRIVLNQL